MLKAWKRKEGANGRYKSYRNTDTQDIWYTYRVHIHIYVCMQEDKSETELEKRIIHRSILGMHDIVRYE